jgi:hypothetical protein
MLLNTIMNFPIHKFTYYLTIHIIKYSSLRYVLIISSILHLGSEATAFDSGGGCSTNSNMFFLKMAVFCVVAQCSLA